jgi:hypothetical protein
VRSALAAHIRRDSHRTLARRASRLARAGCGTSGTALGVPHEGPGIEGLAAAGTARNANQTLPGPDRRPPGPRARWCGAGMGPVSRRFHGSAAPPEPAGTTGTAKTVPPDPSYFNQIQMIGTRRNIDRNRRRSLRDAPAVRGRTVGGVPGRPDACCRTPACLGWMRPEMDTSAVAGAGRGAFWRITAGVRAQLSCAPS